MLTPVVITIRNGVVLVAVPMNADGSSWNVSVQDGNDRSVQLLGVWRCDRETARNRLRTLADYDATNIEEG